MYELAILTTAIIRPEIHIKSLNSVKKILKKYTKILWIINLDFVNIFPKNVIITDKIIEQCFNNTMITIKTLFLNYNITFKFILNKVGNFNNAVRNLVKEVENMIDNIKLGILYFEDDWVISRNGNNIYYYLHLLDNRQGEKNNIYGYRFSFRECIGNVASFRPTIWSLDGFKDIFISAFRKNNDIKKDPENILIEYWKKEKSEYIIMCLPYELNVIDIGRNLVQQKGLIKWNRHIDSETTYNLV